MKRRITIISHYQKGEFDGLIIERRRPTDEKKRQQSKKFIELVNCLAKFAMNGSNDDNESKRKRMCKHA